jgi:hypothetical protein
MLRLHRLTGGPVGAGCPPGPVRARCRGGDEATGGGAIDPDAAYPMTRAMRLKGVATATILPAIRTGRLPATRPGDR